MRVSVEKSLTAFYVFANANCWESLAFTVNGQRPVRLQRTTKQVLNQYNAVLLSTATETGVCVWHTHTCRQFNGVSFECDLYLIGLDCSNVCMSVKCWMFRISTRGTEKFIFNKYSYYKKVNNEIRLSYQRNQFGKKSGDHTNEQFLL